MTDEALYPDWKYYNYMTDEALYPEWRYYNYMTYEALYPDYEDTVIMWLMRLPTLTMKIQ